MNSKRILFLDDDRALIMAMQRLFRKAFHIDCATSIDDAIELLESQAHYAMVISDLHLPTGDGVSFLKIVSERWPTVVRLMLTGGGDAKNLAVHVSSGLIWRLLQKPCGRNELIQVFEDAFDYHEKSLSAPGDMRINPPQSES